MGDMQLVGINNLLYVCGGENVIRPHNTFLKAYYTIKIAIAMDNNLSQVDDEFLIKLIQEGRHDAFAEIVNRHSKRFYNIAYRFIFNKDDAEDIVQEALIKLWEKRLSWNPNKEAKFTTWFYKVLLNLCIDHNKKKKPVPLSEEMPLIDKQQGHESVMQEKQKQVMLERFIQELPERQQLALNLCFYEGISNQEAAEIIGVNLKALQSLIMRAKMTLKEKVKPYFDEGIS
jgi:RNA polymerase sigma-70 factor (ECF subfamily)